jgi:cellulose synthase/poly-beta-1,6-N-acetylglucosamine synthase-like glycosyltransferase
MNPVVSIIIPCRNENKIIGACLDSVISQDYSKDLLEVLVVDGISDDGTRAIVQKYTEQYPFIRLLDNQKKIVPTALNIGINNSRGLIIVRMDAHTIYEKNYISKCVKYLISSEADNVGGVLITLPANKSMLADAISISVSHPFGIGNAYFRSGVKEPRYVDTVPFGCYRKEVFEEIGFFDEDLVRNQDDEFNMRLIKGGGKILLVPDIVSYYYARDSLSKLFRMYFQYGYFKPLVAEKVGGVLTWRQLIPSFFVGSLIVSSALSIVFKPFLWVFFLILLLYLSANLLFSFQISMKKGLKYFPVLPVVFSTIHFSYGIGYLKGILDFLILKKNRKKKIQDLPLTR